MKTVVEWEFSWITKKRVVTIKVMPLSVKLDSYLRDGDAELQRRVFQGDYGILVWFVKPNCSVDSHGDAMVELDMKKYLGKPQTLQNMLILSFMNWYGGETAVIETALPQTLNGEPGGLAFRGYCSHSCSGGWSIGWAIAEAWCKTTSCKDCTSRSSSDKAMQSKGPRKPSLAYGNLPLILRKGNECCHDCFWICQTQQAWRL